MECFKGKSTGKPHISRENLWFPIDFPINQSIDTPQQRNHKESHPTRVVNAHLRLQTPCVAWHPWPPWPGISQSGWISVDIRSLPWISGEIKPNSYHRITETKTKTTPGLSCTSTPTNHTCISIYIYIIYIYLYTKYWVAVSPW